MRQILLITDGCSNVGVSPVVAAAHAKEEGITVNVIGVVDQGELGMLGAEEIREIAEAGGDEPYCSGASAYTNRPNDDTENGNSIHAGGGKQRAPADFRHF